MVARARALWGSLWWAPALPWVGYAIVLAGFGLVRWEHVLLALLVAGLAYGTERTRRFFLGGLPLLILFLLYDSMRYWEDVGLSPGRVLGCQLHSAELALFGVPYHGARITLNELFAIHHAPLIDLVCAIPYGTYLMIMVGTWIALYATDRVAARRYAWTALAAHVMAFVTYHVVPAAPPWYVATHGCTIDLAAHGSTAGLARVDDMLGVAYFHDLYARGSAVFGALPSLHVAYPWLGILATFGRVRARTMLLELVYAAVMAFASVYLGHHYVIDGLLGITYAFVAYALVRAVLREPEARAREVEETAGAR
jgi:hypothetical protein